MTHLRTERTGARPLFAAFDAAGPRPLPAARGGAAAHPPAHRIRRPT
ncbi:hypothetical protein [Streptomyces sp. NPDC086010]